MHWPFNISLNFTKTKQKYWILDHFENNDSLDNFHIRRSSHCVARHKRASTSQSNANSKKINTKTGFSKRKYAAYDRISTPAKRRVCVISKMRIAPVKKSQTPWIFQNGESCDRRRPLRKYLHNMDMNHTTFCCVWKKKTDYNACVIMLGRSMNKVRMVIFWNFFECWNSTEGLSNIDFFIMKLFVYPFWFLVWRICVENIVSNLKYIYEIKLRFNK